MAKIVRKPKETTQLETEDLSASVRDLPGIRLCVHVGVETWVLTRHSLPLQAADESGDSRYSQEPRQRPGRTFVFVWGSGLEEPAPLSYVEDAAVVSCAVGRTQKMGVTVDGRILSWVTPRRTSSSSNLSKPRLERVCVVCDERGT